MMRIDEKVSGVLKNLAYFNLAFPSTKTLAVHRLLTECLENLEALKAEPRTHPEIVQITYDLLLVYTSRIEQTIGQRDWTVNSLLQMLDQCSTDPQTPAEVTQNHALKRGLILYESLSWSELSSLGEEAYRRIGTLVQMPLALSLNRKMKLTLGNIFAGQTNARIFSKIYPYLAQLSLPVGPLKQDFHSFVNLLVSDLISTPIVNGHRSVLRLEGEGGVDSEIRFDFVEAINLLSLISDRNILLAMGDTPESLDVRAVRSKIRLIRQLRVMLFEGQPSRVQSALTQRPLLQENFKALFGPLQGLRPLYTWGSAMDEAFNDLLDEVKIFSAQMMDAVIHPAQTAPQPSVLISWNIMRFWKGPAHAFSSTIDMINEIVLAMMPKINALIQKMMPENKLALLIANCTPPIYSIIEHSLGLVRTLEARGIYDPVTQAFLAPLRGHLQGMDMKSLQAAIAVYKYQLEPLIFKIVNQNNEAAMVWANLSVSEKNTMLLNAAALIHHLRKGIRSLLPMLDPRLVVRLHEALLPSEEACLHFDSMIGQATLLQLFLKKDAEVILSQVIEILGQNADTVTAGSATNTALRQSLGTVVGVPLGAVAELTVGILSVFQLNLSFHPANSGVKAMPPEWNDKNLKTILKEELVQSLGLMKQVNSLHLGLQYEASATLQEKNTLGTVI